MKNLFVSILISWSLTCFAETPIKKEVLRTNFRIQIYIIAPDVNIQTVCIRQGAIYPPHGKRIAGCSQYDAHLNLLYIWVYEPRFLEDNNLFGVIGHEVWHGVRGAFHD